MRYGFSLVELSIVLVILGLLTGGILAGQSLIRAAELRAVTTEYQRWITATQTFRDKYFALPGDFRDATKFWDRNVTNGWCVSNSSKAGPAVSGACDGNGDGNVDNGPAASQSGEIFQFWRHLALAGLIEGTYSGLAGADGIYDCEIGTNCPASRLGNAGWSARWLPSSFAGDASAWYALDFGNFLQFGTHIDPWMTEYTALKPEEAWNIDSKMDDGKPAQGKVIAMRWIACTTSTSAVDYAGDYRLNDAALQCALHFRKLY